MRYSNKAFTLVELAIVMTIVGLLIGGVLKGQELLENSRMTSLSSQLKSYEAAIATFRDIYKGLPGDHNNATNVIKGCTGANNCANGDGDGAISSSCCWWFGYDTAEAFQSWKHLVLADLIKGVDPSRARTATSYRGGVDVPASPLGGQMYLKTVQQGTAAQFAGQVNIGGQIVALSIVTDGDTGIGSGGMFSPSTAQKIDLKLDDGRAFSGDTMAVSSGWTSGCGSTANGTNGYNINLGGAPCSMAFSVGR